MSSRRWITFTHVVQHSRAQVKSSECVESGDREGGDVSSEDRDGKQCHGLEAILACSLRAKVCLDRLHEDADVKVSAETG
jgi:hypothetical protein